MTVEGVDLANMLNRMLQLVANEIQGLDDEVLNRDLPFSPANTVFQLGTHVVGSARWWSITNTAGTDFHRDRDAEFAARGNGPDLLADYATLQEQITDHVSRLTAEDLERPITHERASISHWKGRVPLTQRDSVLHSIEHTGIHLGHIQLTRQVFGIPVRTDWE